MAESTSTVPSTVPAQAASGGEGQGQAEFTVPAGKHVMDARDYERHTQQLRDLSRYQQFYGTAKSLGISDEKGFEPIKAINERLGKRNLTMDHVLKMLDATESQPAQGGGEQPSFDIDEMRAAIKAEVLGEYRKESAKEKALREHEEGLKGESALFDKFVSELVGDKATALEKRQWKALLKEEAENHWGYYDEGHPLRNEHRRAFDEKSAGPVFESLKKLRAEAAGASLASDAKKAAEAVRKPTPSVAGNTGGQGKPDNDGKPRMRPGGVPPREVLEAAAAAKAARRGG